MTPSVTLSRLLAALAIAGVAIGIVAAALGHWTDAAICAVYVAIALATARSNAKAMAANRDRRRARALAAARRDW